jgi:hypothetical protein
MSARRGALIALIAAVLLGVGVFAAGQLGDGGLPLPGRPEPPPAVWPLTGQVAPAEPDWPVVVVKVDNTAAAQPQVGLDDADLVVQELVEGGLTRLAVMVHSRLADDDGAGRSAAALRLAPVRSVRSSDVGIVAPTGGVLVASGGAAGALRDLRAADVPVVLEGDDALSRDPARAAPYNVVVDAAAVPKRGQAAPPEPLLPFEPPQGEPDGGDDQDATGRSAQRLEVRFSAADTTVFERRGEGQRARWRRTNAPVVADADFAADTVLVLRVRTRPADYVDPAGNPVPVTITTGKGSGLLVHGEAALRVRWTKQDEKAAWELATRDGDPVQVPPGRTWLALVPLQGAVTVE